MEKKAIKSFKLKDTNIQEAIMTFPKDFMLEFKGYKIECSIIQMFLLSPIIRSLYLFDRAMESFSIDFKSEFEPKLVINAIYFLLKTVGTTKELKIEDFEADQKKRDTMYRVFKELADQFGNKELSDYFEEFFKEEESPSFENLDENGKAKYVLDTLKSNPKNTKVLRKLKSIDFSKIENPQVEEIYNAIRELKKKDSYIDCNDVLVEALLGCYNHFFSNVTTGQERKVQAAILFDRTKTQNNKEGILQFLRNTNEAEILKIPFENRFNVSFYPSDCRTKNLDCFGKIEQENSIGIFESPQENPYICFEFSEKLAIDPKTYLIRTHSGRNHFISWYFEATENNVHWIELSHVVNHKNFQSPCKTESFPCNNNQGKFYRYFRLRLDSKNDVNNDNNTLILLKLEIYGIVKLYP